MALYHQLKSPSTFIEYRSVSEWKGVIVISNFDSLEAALGSCLVCLGLNSPLLSICNTYCFSTATMVARTRLNVTLYVHCQSCFYSTCALGKQFKVKHYIQETRVCICSSSLSTVT